MRLIVLVFLSILFLNSKAQVVKERIAVLDFQILTNNEDLEKYRWLSLGFAETLNDVFSRIDRFSVIERSRLSVIFSEQEFQKGNSIDTSSIVKAGRILGVNKILLGSCQIYSGKMLVTMRIVNVETAEIYPIKGLPKIVFLDEVLTTQEAICIEILKQFDAIQPSQMKREIQSLTSKSTRNFRAYEYLNRGLEFFHTGQYSEALSMYNMALDYDKKYRKVFFKRGLTNVALKRFEYAADDFEKSSDYVKKDSVYLLIGEAYFKAGNLKKSLEYLKKAEKSNPNNGRVQTYLSMLRSNEGGVDDDNLVAKADVGKYQTVFEFFDGVAKAKMNNKYGYIDTLDRIIVPFIFDEIGNFKHGLAPAKVGKKWGYINRKGAVVIPIRFDEAEDFNERKLAEVGIKDKNGIINLKGEVIIPIEYDYISRPQFNELIIVTKFSRLLDFKGKYGVYDKDGKIILPVIYDDVDLFPGSHVNEKYKYIHVAKKGKWGVVDKNNNIIVPLVYECKDCIRPFKNNFAAVKVNERWGYVNEKGIIVVKPNYDNVSDFENGLFQVKQKGKWGLLDSMYNEVFPPIYDAILFLKGSYYAAQRGSFWGIINIKKSTIVCEFIYDAIGEIATDKIVAISTRVDGYYDKNFLFIPVSKNGKLFWINEKCECVYDCN